MKGVLFNVVEQVVDETFGPDVWDRAVDLAGVDGAYTSLGSYPDDDLVQLVAALAELLHVSRRDVLVVAGRKGFRHLGERHGDLIESMGGWREVLAELDHIIHPEVRKIYPDAHVPRFAASSNESAVRLQYDSDRQLCSLAEGLALGLGDWYGADLAVEHVTCVHRGDAQCELEVVER